ncbi:hypothetical protein [Streptomyces neyagawaensis]|uniref:hypothetical protein n=1 Tax=Streptomyces neyagawaensis TaxID=42238 RepID=UPI00201D030B|nr:hypothetical protein [Streptomyces neyagawaensis]MCL6732129.1 hypothetical protein [Streptomyces neyagawaensis]MDE1682376.1 hypothetical protein [Streptomyces neyagawaensis]
MRDARSPDGSSGEAAALAPAARHSAARATSPGRAPRAPWASLPADAAAAPPLSDSSPRPCGSALPRPDVISTPRPSA